MLEWLGYYRPIKKAVTLRLDADVLAWFKRQGRGYQTRINRALRKLMSEERKISGDCAGGTFRQLPGFLSPVSSVPRFSGRYLT